MKTYKVFFEVDIQAEDEIMAVLNARQAVSKPMEKGISKTVFEVKPVERGNHRPRRDGVACTDCNSLDCEGCFV